MIEIPNAVVVSRVFHKVCDEFEGAEGFNHSEVSAESVFVAADFDHKSNPNSPKVNAESSLHT